MRNVLYHYTHIKHFKVRQNYLYSYVIQRQCNCITHHTVQSSHECQVSNYIRFVFVCIWLWDWFCKRLCKILTSEWVAAVVRDEIIQAVKQLLFNQVVHRLTVLLLRPYAAMIHRRVRRTLPPETDNFVLPINS